MLDIIAILLALAAFFSFINLRYLHLQMTIGLMLLAFILVIMLSLFKYLGFSYAHSHFMNILTQLDFSQIVLQGILCFLLFASSKNISLKKLRLREWDVITLAIFGTLSATFIIGTLMYFILHALGLALSYIDALIFGAIISPTDPIAALAILKNVGLPSNLEVVLDGESQFNDGVGVVIFVTLTSIAFGHESPSLIHITTLFIQAVLGGVGLGLIMAMLTHLLVRNANDVITEVLITLAAVSGGYAIAETIHVSGPIASVVLGLVVGNKTLPHIAAKKTRDHIDLFWDLIDQVLNAILFVLIGLMALLVGVPTLNEFWGIVIAIMVVLIGRYLSVYFSMVMLNMERKFNFSSRHKIANLFTWSGLRGALAVALVLSLPDGTPKNQLLPMVYGVVIFSILVQGTTIKRFFPPAILQRLAQPTNKQ